MKQFSTILLLAAFCSPAWSAPPATWEGKINRFVDGDTAWIERGDKEVKVRLWLADAPEIKHRPREKDQPGGPEAHAYANKTWSGKQVAVKPKGESYGRIVAELTEAETQTNVGLDLVSSGHAAVDRRFSPPKPYLAAEQEAREEKRGIWADPAAVSPWDWRKRQRVRGK